MNRTIALSPLVVAAAMVMPMRVRAAEPTRSEAPAGVRVQIAESAGDLEVMRKWMHDAAAGGMGDAGVRASEIAAGRELVIEVEGALLEYAYRVAVQPGAPGQVDAPLVTCQCTDQELVARVRGAVASVAPKLRADVEVAPPVPANVEETPPAGLGAGGKAGAALVGVGAAASIAGIVLIALPPRYDADPGALEQEVGKTFRVPGGVTLGIGVGLVVTGAVLLHRDRARAKRVAITPWGGQRSAGAVASFRF